MAAILFLLLLSFFRQLLSQLAEQSSTKTRHVLGNEWDLKMYVRNLRHPLQIRAQNRLLRRLRNLTANSLYIIGQVRWKPQGISYIVAKCHELWFTNGLQLDCHFHPPSVNSAFYLIARLRLHCIVYYCYYNFFTIGGQLRWALCLSGNPPLCFVALI